MCEFLMIVSWWSSAHDRLSSAVPPIESCSDSSAPSIVWFFSLVLILPLILQVPHLEFLMIVVDRK